MSFDILKFGCDKNHKNENQDTCTEMTDPKPKKILLECGQNLEPARFDVDDTNEQTFTLGRVIVDTGCLRKPEVKLEFSSIIFFQSMLQNSTLIGGATIVLTFRVRRSCDNGPLVQRLERIYRKEINVGPPEVREIISSETFTISFCEKLDSPKCCEYVVEVTGNDFFNIGTAEVNDLSLAAFAQGEDCD